MRIGVFGGTFDPVHNGHLAVAVNVRFALGLDVVLMVVANQPWQKVPGRRLSRAVDRLAVLEAGVADLDGIEASSVEIEMGGTSFTVDTLAELDRRHVGANFYLIVGADAAAGLGTWKKPDEVRRLARLVVVNRPSPAGGEGWPLPEGWEADHVEVPALDISSTEIRARVRDGRPLDFLVPPASVHCLRRLSLYAGPE
ncbi:MAG: nicotinate-nucleotide adenylyltransferase [Acidimicrobiales bacterium]